jgi:hypothetical protein
MITQCQYGDDTKAELSTPHTPTPVGLSDSRLAVQSDALSLGPKHLKTSHFAVIRRSTWIGCNTPETYYRSYKGATSCVNRCASWICHIRLSRKKLQEKLLHMILTEFSSLEKHKISHK